MSEVVLRSEDDGATFYGLHSGVSATLWTVAPFGRGVLIGVDGSLMLATQHPLTTQTVACFDTLLRHINPHAKWTLIKVAPADHRLIPGMQHVAAEKWGWQENAAIAWLAAISEAESSTHPSQDREMRTTAG